MKARDIIPSWPRGKSTTQPTVPPLTWWESHDGTLYEMVEICHPGSERHYHAEQQFMVDQFLGHGQMWNSLSMTHALGLFESTIRTACGMDLRYERYPLNDQRMRPLPFM